MSGTTSKAKSVKNVLAKRLKEARVRAKISQKALGIQSGMDEFVASARVNQYERGTHSPDYSVATQLARVLGVPTAYLYADKDDEAELLLRFADLNKKQRAALLKLLEPEPQQT